MYLKQCSSAILTQLKHKLRMESTTCTILLLLLAGASIKVEAADWNYDDKGPSTWATLFPEFCAGQSQSPIDLNSKIAEVAYPDPGPIQFHDYELESDAVIKNNGHSVVFSFENNSFTPTITGGRLPNGSVFQFLSLHWHWGSVSTRGSEHTMDGKEFPLELHIIHWNTKYGNISESLKHHDGLAVLGFFYEVSEDDNEDLQPIIEKLKAIKLSKKVQKQKRGIKDPLTKSMLETEDAHVKCIWDDISPVSGPSLYELCPGNREVGEEKNMIHLDENMSLSQFLPPSEDGEKYFYYQGGLTTPHCNEIVQWTNFLRRNKISESQLEALRSLYDGTGNGTAIEDNFRPPQPLNGRTLNIRKPMMSGGKVNCGCHWAKNCKLCGKDALMCNGECSWQCKEDWGCMCAPNHKMYGRRPT